MELIIHRSSTPVSGTHLRTTSRQFTEVSSRSRSRPSPSPFMSLFRRHLSPPDTPLRVDIEVPTRPSPAVIQDLQGSPDNSAHSSPEITVQVEQPSPGLPVASSSSPSRLSTVRDQMQSLPMHRQLPSTESVNSSADSSRSRGQSPSVLVARRNPHSSHGSIRHHSSSLQSMQTPHEPSFTFPEASVSRVTIDILETMGWNTRPPERRLMKPMHPDKVSRYMRKGDVCVLSATQASFLYRDMSSGQGRRTSIR
jgi:hypothetical protein